MLFDKLLQSAQAPQGGFFDALQNTVESPLFLGGIGMMSGGFEGLSQGLFSGHRLQDARRQREQEDASRQGIFGLLDDGPLGDISDTEKMFFRSNPDQFLTALNNIYAERFDPNSGLRRQGLQADLDYKRAMTQKALAAEGVPVKDRANIEEGLRKEYAGLAKPYFDVRDAYTRVETSAKDPSAAGDLALIFNYMKMLDPGSVVREGEFATAQNAAGVPDQVRNFFNRVMNGERMNPEQRDDFVARARQLYDGQEQQYRAIQDQYRGISERIGADPQNTILNFGRPAEGGPPPGDVDPAQMPAGQTFQFKGRTLRALGNGQFEEVR